jgi:hypothetical protein
MSNYIKRPKDVVRKEIIVEKTIEKQTHPLEGLDLAGLANAVAQAISLKIPQGNVNGNGIVNETSITEDTFDSSKTLQRLADEMIVERGDNEANFDNLGNVEKTKRDQKDVDDTINLLSGLD